jgi:hypothetical protein
MNNAVHLINTPPAKTLRMRARVGHLLPLNLARRLALPLFLLCGVVLARPCAATPLQWDLTGSLNTGAPSAHSHLAAQWEGVGGGRVGYKQFFGERGTV